MEAKGEKKPLNRFYSLSTDRKKKSLTGPDHRLFFWLNLRGCHIYGTLKHGQFLHIYLSMQGGCCFHLLFLNQGKSNRDTWQNLYFTKEIFLIFLFISSTKDSQFDVSSGHRGPSRLPRVMPMECKLWQIPPCWKSFKCESGNRPCAYHPRTSLA